MKYLFVYGTLKGKNNLLARSPFIATVYTEPKYKLYLSTFGMEFPCMVESEKGISIKGDLYLVNDEDIPNIDKYECAPELFKSQKIKLKNQGFVKFNELEVYAYIYQEDVSKLEKLNSNEYIV